MKFKTEVEQYAAWRKMPLDAAGCSIFIVQEKQSELQIQDADSDVLFFSEVPPLTLEEYDFLKALALQSAQDFLELYQSIPNKNEPLQPARKTFYGDVPVSAQKMYEHTKNVNAYYFGEIKVLADNEPDIYACRLAAFEALEQQPDFLCNRVYDGSYGEQWSLRKVCRRFVWHDRIHAKAMYRLAAQLYGADMLSNPFCFRV